MAINQSSLHGFARNHHIEGLSTPSLKALNQGNPGYSIEKARKFINFQDRINEELLKHRIIEKNRYTQWFRQGQQNRAQIKAFIVQFSVFSNQFLVAQMNKMINADSLESMRASKEILANEIGVRFHSDNKSDSDKIYGSTQGSVEGSTFRFAAAHFEWLYTLAQKLNMSFCEIGQVKHGTASTRFFCNELIRLYGGEHYQNAQAASYAVENWAAAGFWGELIEGLKTFNHKQSLNLPLGFFVWHDRIESQHAEHTQEELEELYFAHQLNEDAFIAVGNEMLDGVAEFWDGLDLQRRELAAAH